MQRRAFVSSLFLSICLLSAALMGDLPVQAQTLDVDAILHDPDAPTGGNPKGDVTIVAFLDYNCPYCKKSAPELEKIVKTDGHIRLVYKDWPILSAASVYGAKLALAAAYQGQYETVHKALMDLPGRRIKEDAMLAAVKATGVDMDRLQADAATHADAITALLRRNLDQANALGLEGTPVYLVGPFRTSTLDYEGFKQAVADARKKQAGQ